MSGRRCRVSIQREVVRMTTVAEFEDAVRALEQQTGIVDYDALDALTPTEQWHPLLAAALKTLADRQWAVSQYGAAVQTLLKRVKLYERLAKADAATFKPLLA